jgi:hypothetical protein
MVVVVAERVGPPALVVAVVVMVAQDILGHIPEIPMVAVAVVEQMAMFLVDQ